MHLTNVCRLQKWGQANKQPSTKKKRREGDGSVEIMRHLKQQHINKLQTLCSPTTQQHSNAQNCTPEKRWGFPSHFEIAALPNSGPCCASWMLTQWHEVGNKGSGFDLWSTLQWNCRECEGNGRAPELMIPTILESKTSRESHPKLKELWGT